MNIMKKIGAAGLAFVTGSCMLAGCSREKHSRGPLELKKVTYVCYAGDVEEVSVYVFTPDLKLREYETYPENVGKYDYPEGELPPEDQYTLKDYDIEETYWNNLALVFTRVNIMELDEEIPEGKGYDLESTYIRVETEDAVNKTGGYGAGLEDDSVSRRYSSAEDAIQYGLSNSLP